MRDKNRQKTDKNQAKISNQIQMIGMKLCLADVFVHAHKIQKFLEGERAFRSNAKREIQQLSVV